jgi:hypothetical protein
MLKQLLIYILDSGYYSHFATDTTFGTVKHELNFYDEDETFMMGQSAASTVAAEAESETPPSKKQRSGGVPSSSSASILSRRLPDTVETTDQNEYGVFCLKKIYKINYAINPQFNVLKCTRRPSDPPTNSLHWINYMKNFISPDPPKRFSECRGTVLFYCVGSGAYSVEMRGKIYGDKSCSSCVKLMEKLPTILTDLAKNWDSNSFYAIVEKMKKIITDKNVMEFLRIGLVAALNWWKKLGTFEHNARILKIVDDEYFEDCSVTFCQNCGAPAPLTTNQWIFTDDSSSEIPENLLKNKVGSAEYDAMIVDDFDPYGTNKMECVTICECCRSKSKNSKTTAGFNGPSTPEFPPDDDKEYWMRLDPPSEAKIGNKIYISPNRIVEGQIYVTLVTRSSTNGATPNAEDYHEMRKFCDQQDEELGNLSTAIQRQVKVNHPYYQQSQDKYPDVKFAGNRAYDICFQRTTSHNSMLTDPNYVGDETTIEFPPPNSETLEFHSLYNLVMKYGYIYRSWKKASSKSTISSNNDASCPHIFVFMFKTIDSMSSNWISVHHFIQLLKDQLEDLRLVYFTYYSRYNVHFEPNPICVCAETLLHYMDIRYTGIPGMSVNTVLEGMKKKYYHTGEASGTQSARSATAQTKKMKEAKSQQLKLHQ